MAGNRAEAGYGGRHDLGRIWRVTGFGQDMAGNRAEAGYGGRHDLGRIWRVTVLRQYIAGAGLRQDMEGDRTETG